MSKRDTEPGKSALARMGMNEEEIESQLEDTSVSMKIISMIVLSNLCNGMEDHSK